MDVAFQAGRSGPADVLRMQRTLGNRYFRSALQTKLEVSQPGDPYEREADQVADRILSMPAQAQAPAQSMPTPSARAAGTTQQSDAANAVEPHAEEAVSSATRSSGQPLPEGMQRKFEQALGTDLSAVRVHTGTESVEASRAIHARAFALGQDIHFNQGQYNPDSSGGQRLLAHEVVHTVQQGGG